jgi:hypothetical protein
MIVRKSAKTPEGMIEIEQWKLDALLRGAFNRTMAEMITCDEAQQARADAAERKRAAAHAAARHGHYQRLYARCDAAEDRCDRLLAREKERQEARARVDAALRDAEEKVHFDRALRRRVGEQHEHSRALAVDIRKD